MELLREVHNLVAERDIYAAHGIDINQVYGTTPTEDEERAGKERAGEHEWFSRIAARKHAMDYPEKKDELSKARGAKTSPEAGDLIILPGGQRARVKKNFMGKITVADATGDPITTVNMSKIVGPGRSPEGQVTWAVKK